MNLKENIQTFNLKERSNFRGDHINLLKERMLSEDGLEKLLAAWKRHVDTNKMGSHILRNSPFKVDYEMGRLLGFEDISAELLREKIESYFKNIKFNTEGRTEGGYMGADVNLYSINPKNGMFYTDFELQVAASHELGHTFRYFAGESEVTKLLKECVSLESVIIPDDYAEFKIQHFNSKPFRKKINTLEESREAVKEYLTEPYEIIERLSQIKNYFGLKAREKVTWECIQYAKEHYVQDYGFYFEWQMAPFLSMLVEENKEKILKCMNELPV